jgi:hypothetical protein
MSLYPQNRLTRPSRSHVVPCSGTITLTSPYRPVLSTCIIYRCDLDQCGDRTATYDASDFECLTPRPPSSTSPSPSRQRTSTLDRKRPCISAMAYLNHGVTSSRRGRRSGRHEIDNVARNIVAFKPLTRSDKAVDTGSHSPSVEPSWTHVRRSPDSLELPPDLGSQL